MGCGGSKPDSAVAPDPLLSTAKKLSRSGSSEASFRVERRYEKGKLLGQGGFGSVYSVKDRQTGKMAALKIISKLKFAGEEERQNMITEVELMRRCRGHPYVVEFMDSYEDKANFYLVLEQCTGGELMDAIINSQTFSEAEAARYFRQMAEAIVWCHDKLVVHRDIKPENFLLVDRTPESALKVTDFGLACAIPDKDAIITDACGSAYYIAPEVFSKKYTRAADVWSLGVVLFLLLSGNVPFGSDSDSEAAVYKSIQRDPLVFGAGFANISSAARELLSGLLEKDPAKRYTLEQALAHPWVTGSAPSTVLDKKILSALSGFNARNRFKKAAIKMVASTLKAADVAALRAQFNAIDTDATGYITYKEMADALKLHLGVTDDTKVAEILKNIDENGDGKLSYNEWLQGMLETRVIHHQTAVWSAFNTFDMDGDGAITVDEICSVLQGMSPEEARACVAEYDTDGDGVIRYDEFLKMMLGKDLRVKISPV